MCFRHSQKEGCSVTVCKRFAGDDKAPTPIHATARCHQSNFYDDSSDKGDDEEYNDEDPSEMLDQDEDVLQAAEEAQQEGLSIAAECAELEVKVTQAKQSAASAALSKVSQGRIQFPQGYLLIAHAS